MKQDRTLLEQNLIKPTLEIKRKKKVVKDIKNYLLDKYSIFDGSVQTWINNPALELPNLDVRLLYLFAEQIYAKTGNLSIDPEEYFTPAEVKKAKQYSEKLYIDEEIQFPLRFQPAISHGTDSWVTKIDIKTLVKLLNANKLHWNPESQREATYKKVKGEMIEEATLIMSNVNEMKMLLKKGKLVSSQLTLNASVGTSDFDEEVVYDESSYELFINSGTKLDIVDGFHRIIASKMAFIEKPDIEFEFDLKILNLPVDRAAEYLAQISKGERISEVKRRRMGKDKESDFVINELEKRSELRGKISKKERLATSRNEIVTYLTLSDAIERNFDLTEKKNRFEIADYLIEFFDTLLTYFEEEFIEKYSETAKKSIINADNMFDGYITLASRMREKGISARDIKNYVNLIDFSRENKEWYDYGVLDEKGRFVHNPKTGIQKVINELELNGEKVSS